MFGNGKIFLLAAALALTASAAQAADCSKPSPIMATHTAPPYPEMAEASLEQGITTLKVTVGPDGTPSDASVVGSSGSAQLDDMARDHLKAKWRWAPGSCSAQTQVAISWTLRPDPALDTSEFAVNPEVVTLHMKRGDYPPGALERKAQGVDGLTMIVSPYGKISRMELTSRSGGADLDARAVELVKTRYHWKPITVAGRDMSTLYYVVVQWDPEVASRN